MFRVPFHYATHETGHEFHLSHSVEADRHAGRATRTAMSGMAREMFGVRREANATERERVRPRSVASSRPEGVSRELFMLTGGRTPTSLMPTAPLGLQSKPEARRKWEIATFRRSPEEASLTLKHWAPVGQPHDAYAFARFNKPVRMMTYTDTEYDAVVAHLLPLNVDESTLTEPRRPAPRTPRTPKPTQKAALLAAKAAARIEKLAKLKKDTEPASSDAVTAAITPISTATPATPTIAVTTTVSPPNVKSPAVGATTSATSPLPAVVMGPKTLKDIMSPIVKAPSAAPPSSVAAGTRKSFIASPKALALAAEAANIEIPDPTVKPPSQQRVPKRSSRRGSETEKEPPTHDNMYHVALQKVWTRQETDLLFELCSQFDLRFPIIYDRWTLAPRSVEELKDRYYSVSKAVIEYRKKLNKEALSGLPIALQKHCQAIVMNPYDYEYECIRKNQLEWQYRRSKKELREEEETVREARRIEQGRKRSAKERQRMAKLLGANTLGIGTAGGAPAKTFSHRKVITGAFARSSMIYAPVSNSQRVSKRIDAALAELGVGTRPTPTSIVVDNFDLLRLDIFQFIELQRTVARKEEDVHLLRVKLAKLKGEEPPQPPPGVNLSHKKRKADDMENGSLFGPPTTTAVPAAAVPGGASRK